MAYRGLAALLLLLVSTAVSAQGTNTHKWVLDAGFGESTLDHDPGFTEIDDTSTAYSFRVGYRFSRYFALEAGYIDIGDFSAAIVPPCVQGPCPPTLRETSSISGILLNSRFIWPAATHFHLNASLGMLWHRRDTEFSSSSGSSFTDAQNNGGFSYGLGIAVPLNDRFEIGLDFTQFLELGVALNLSENPSIRAGSDSRVLALHLRARF